MPWIKAGLDDTLLTWDLGTDADLDHYEIVIRETTSDKINAAFRIVAPFDRGLTATGRTSS